MENVENKQLQRHERETTSIIHVIVDKQIVDRIAVVVVE